MTFLIFFQTCTVSRQYNLQFMNPLLNRLYEGKIRSTSFSTRRKSDHHVQKQLVPKMRSKKEIQQRNQIEQTKNNPKYNNIIKTHVNKLPAIPPPPSMKNVFLQVQKPSTKKSFRQRKLSSKIHDIEKPIFPTELSLKDGDHKQGTITETYKHYERLSDRIQQMHQHDFVLEQKQLNNEDELFQYLRILEENADLKQQFCYMNRGELPYSYYIVEYDDRNMQQHLTVSLRGITLYKDQDNQFYTIKKMRKQIQKYRKIKQIDFFKQYLATKVFRHWHLRTITKKFQQQCNFLEANLFSQNPQLQKYLFYLHSQVQDFSRSKFLDLHIVTTQDLESFKKKLYENYKKILSTIAYLENDIEEKLRQTIQISLKKFRSEKRVTIGTEKKKQEPYLPYDNQKRDMKYTQMAKLKEFQGCMYRLMKYTDHIRFNIKLNIIKNGLLNYQQQLEKIHQYVKDKNSLAFVNWVKIATNFSHHYPQGNPTKQKDQPSITTFVCQPTLQEVQASLLQHKQHILRSIFKSHYLICEKKNEFYCENFQDDVEEKPTKLDLKYYVTRNQQVISLLVKCDKLLNGLIEVAQRYLENVGNEIAKIYDNSYIQEINFYMNNQSLKQYLQTHVRQTAKLAQAQPILDLGLFLLEMQQPIKIARQKFTRKFKKITVAIPQEVLKRCEDVVDEIKMVYAQFVQNPSTISQYLQFMRKYRFYKPKLQELDGKIDGLLQLQEMTFRNGIRIGQGPKLHIQQCSTFFKQLSKRFDEIQAGQDNDRKKFETNVQAIIPTLQEKSQNLFKDIYADTEITSPSTNFDRALEKLHSEYVKRYENIKAKKEQLFYYQDEFALGHNQIQNYFRLERNIDWLLKLWKGRKNLGQYEQLLKQKGYGKFHSTDLKNLTTFIQDITNAYNDIQLIQLLQQFKNKAEQTNKMIKICKLASADTLLPQHIQKIYTFVEFKIKDINFKNELFAHYGVKNYSGQQLIENTNLMDVVQQLEEIVFISAQENIIKKKLVGMDQYWKKAKVKIMTSDASRSGLEIPHLDHAANQELHQMLGDFVMTLKNIEGSSHNVGIVAEKVNQQFAICNYLRQLLWKWSQVEDQWLKLLPLMTNCPSVKHQSNVYFEFTSVDTTMKKYNKQIQQLPTIKKFIDDINQKKYLRTFEKCGKDLAQVNKIFQNFLENKRATYHRFYFLADNQLITILQNTRDVHSFGNYAGLCFNCDKILTEKDLACGFETELQTFKLRKTILRGQPEEMFKAVQQNMKISIRLFVQGLLPKIKSKQNITQEFKDFPLQVMIVVDRIIWTEYSEHYLNFNSYDDYLLLIKKTQEELLTYVHRCPKQLWIKVAIRLSQWMGLRQISQMLVKDQITIEDYKWKQQLKYSLVDEQINIVQFANKMTYGFQYYPPSQKILIPTQINKRLMFECFETCSSGDKIIVVGGSENEGKRFNTQQMSAAFGCCRRTVVCNPNISIQYILKFVQGAVNAGIWLTFYQFDQLSNEVLGKLLQNMSKIIKDAKCHPRTLFHLVHQGQSVQKISIYGFKNFSIIEPQRRKICQWLLKIHLFRDIQLLSNRLMGFIEATFPFYNKMLGSKISLMQKIIQQAGKKKIVADKIIKDQIFLVQAIYLQIINKSEDSIKRKLYRALELYFQINKPVQDLEQQELQEQDRISKRIQQLLQSKTVRNIILVGARNCKTTILNKCLQKQAAKMMEMSTNMNFHFIYHVYPQASSFFFKPAVIQKLNSMQKGSIVVYDGNKLVREWSDLIVTNSIFIEGEKISLKGKIVIELRSLDSCTPSIASSCQIVYMGQILTKKQRLIKIASIISLQEDPHYAVQLLQQIFGVDLINLKEQYVQVLAKFIKPLLKNKINTRTLQKIVIWFMSVMEGSDFWTKMYGGKSSDYYVHDIYQELVSIDRAKYEGVPTINPQYFIVPTKELIMIYQLINSLLWRNMNVHLHGYHFSGKSSILAMLKSSHSLNSLKNSDHWVKNLKKSLMVVRKEGKNFLLSNSPTTIIIDDIDLGISQNYEFVRQLIDLNLLRDEKFVEYSFQSLKIVTTSRKVPSKDQKFSSRINTIHLEPFSKDGLQTIFKQLFENRFKHFSMNKDVQELIQLRVLKCLLICFDDLSNIYGGSGDEEKMKVGAGQAAIGLIGVMRNLLSLPKRNAYISKQNYQKFFYMHIYSRLREKNFTKRMQWQLQCVIENALKVTGWRQLQQNQSKKIQQQTILYTNRQMKILAVDKLKEQLQRKFQHLVIFEDMLWEVLKLNNQYNCLDSNCLMVGRRGVGKKYTFQISASINEQKTAFEISPAILLAINSQKVLLYEEYFKGKTLMYQNLQQCENDADLETYIDPKQIDTYREALSGVQGKQSKKLIQKIRQYILFVIAIDSKTVYDKLIKKNRNIARWPICQLHQWPKQALISITERSMKNVDLHAQLFLQTNQILQKQIGYSMPLLKYQKYVDTFKQLKGGNYSKLHDSLALYEQINSKFNQAHISVETWERRVNILEAELTQLVQDLSKLLIQNRTQSFIVAILSIVINNQEKALQQRNIQLAEMKKQSQAQIKKMKRVMEKIQKFITALHRHQLGQLKKIYKTNPEIKFGLQCLCVLIGEEENQKGMNKMLADPNLLMKMKSDKILDNRNQKYQAKFQKQLVLYEKNLKQNSLETAKVLFDWLKALIEYWNISDTFKDASKRYTDIKKNYEQTIAKFNATRDNRDHIDKKLKKCIELQQHYQQKKKEAQTQISKIQLKLNNVKLIIPILNKSDESTAQIIKSIKSKIKCLEGNCILSAYTITYLPMCKISVKSQLLKNAQKLMKNMVIDHWENFMEGIDEGLTSGWQAINILTLKYVSGAKIIIDTERKALNYLLQNSEQEIWQSVIPKAQQKTEFQPGKIYHTTIQMKPLNESVVLIDWKYLAFNHKQAIWDKLAQHKKPEYFEAKKNLSITIRRNLLKLQKMKQTLYQIICQKDIKILEDKQFIEIGQDLLKLQEENDIYKTQEKQTVAKINQLAIEIEEQAKKLYFIFELILKYREVSIQVFLNFTCKQGNPIENVLRWCLAQIQYEKRQGFLLTVALSEVFIKQDYEALLKKGVNSSISTLISGSLYEQLLNILTDQINLKENDKNKMKKPVVISQKNWENLVKLNQYTDVFMKVFEIVLQHQKQFQLWSSSFINNGLSESLQQIQMTYIEFLVLGKLFRTPTGFMKMVQKVLSQVLPYNLTPFSLEQLISLANPKYPLIIHCQFQSIKKICSIMNEEKIQIVDVREITLETQMKKPIWRAMDNGSWLIISGLYENKNVKIAQNMVYQALNFQYSPGFRLFIYVDHVPGHKLFTQSQHVVHKSSYIQSTAMLLRQDDPSALRLIKYFKLSPVQTSYSVSPNRSQLGLYQNQSFINSRSPTPQTPRQFPSNFTQYRLTLTLFITHTLLQQRRKNYFGYNLLNRAIKRLQFIRDYEIPLQFNVDFISESIGKIYSTSVPEVLIKQTQQLFERIMQQAKMHEKSLYNVSLVNLQKLDESLKSNAYLYGCTDSQIRRRNIFKMQSTLKTLYKYTFNQKKPQDKIPQMRSILVRIPQQLLYYNELENHYLKDCHSSQIKAHNIRIRQIKNFIEWINVYSNKDEENDQIDPQLVFNWKNLMKKLAQLIGYPIDENQIKSELSKHVEHLKRQHQFLLYWKPNSASFTVFPSLVVDLPKIISSFTIAYFDKMHIQESHIYRIQPEFTHQNQEKDVFTQDGVLLAGMYYRQFKYDYNNKSLEQSVDPNGQQRCPIIILKLKKHQIKRDNEDMQIATIKICKRKINLKNIRNETAYQRRSININPMQNQLFSFSFVVEGVIPEWNLRNCMLIVD